jgi:hypothetical protein
MVARFFEGIDMPQSIRRKRYPAKLSGSAQRNLSLYALAAGAAGVQLLALAQPSEAEVVYTSAHQAIGRNQTYSFDLNHDGVNDFTIINVYGRGCTYIGFHLAARADAGGAIASIPSNPSEHLAKLFRKDAEIGAREGFSPIGANMAVGAKISGQYFAYGDWFNVRDGYLGLSFRIDGQVHYGWARFNVITKNQGFRILAILTGYAYETQPNTPIIAGDTGGAADEESLATPGIGVPHQQKAQTVAALGMLALGAPGLAMWRREGVVASSLG